MNLYTLPENQKLIWNTLLKVPNFQAMIKRDANESEHWFRDIIQMYYNQNKGSNIDKTGLRTLNKETIGYMLSSLKQKGPPQPVSFDNGSAPFQNNFSSLETNTNETRGYILEQKKEQLNNLFQNRQQDYGSLFDKPKVEEIDFREKMEEDKPIENMEELMKRQMAEREYDVQNIAKQFEETKESKEKEGKEGKIQKIETNNDIIEKMSRKIEDLQKQINELKVEQEKMKIDHINKNTDEIISKLRNIDNSNKTDITIRELASHS
jgi:hypothetical protein